VHALGTNSRSEREKGMFLQMKRREARQQPDGQHAVCSLFQSRRATTCESARRKSIASMRRQGSEGAIKSRPDGAGRPIRPAMPTGIGVPEASAVARHANPALRLTSASGTVKDGYTPASTFHGPGREAASQPGASPCVSNALLWCSLIGRAVWAGAAMSYASQQQTALYRRLEQAREDQDEAGRGR
jgi:hypothetical protein